MHFPTLTTATTILLATLTLSAPATTPFATETNITTAHADPLAEPAPLAKRATYNSVRYCQHAHGGGACLTQSFKHAVCYNFNAWWNDRVSSLYPAPNTRCRLHEHRDCRGGNTAVGPNWAAVDLKRSGLNDRATSIDCWSSMG